MTTPPSTEAMKRQAEHTLATHAATGNAPYNGMQLASYVVALAARAERAEAALREAEAHCRRERYLDAERVIRAALGGAAVEGEGAPEKCPRCFGKGLENQDDKPGILLGELGEMECRQCRGSGVVGEGDTP